MYIIRSTQVQVLLNVSVGIFSAEYFWNRILYSKTMSFLSFLSFLSFIYEIMETVTSSSKGFLCYLF